MKGFLRILLLLDKSIRLDSLIILSLIIFGMLCEMAGISLFIPIIMAILEPNFLQNFPEVQDFITHVLGLKNNQIILTL